MISCRLIHCQPFPEREDFEGCCRRLREDHADTMFSAEELATAARRKTDLAWQTLGKVSC